MLICKLHSQVTYNSKHVSNKMFKGKINTSCFISHFFFTHFSYRTASLLANGLHASRYWGLRTLAKCWYTQALLLRDLLNNTYTTFKQYITMQWYYSTLEQITLQEEHLHRCSSAPIEKHLSSYRAIQSRADGSLQIAFVVLRCLTIIVAQLQGERTNKQTSVGICMALIVLTISHTMIGHLCTIPAWYWSKYFGCFRQYKNPGPDLSRINGTYGHPIHATPLDCENRHHLSEHNKNVPQTWKIVHHLYKHDEIHLNQQGKTNFLRTFSSSLAFCHFPAQTKNVAHEKYLGQTCSQ